MTSVREAEAKNGEVDVFLESRFGHLHSNFRIGANIGAAIPLKANIGLSNRGVIPHGAGFVISGLEAIRLGLGTVGGIDKHIRSYRNGRDLMERSRNVHVIDFVVMSESDVRQNFPTLYQWLFDRVKPERDQNRDTFIRKNWWLHARSRADFRPALNSLKRFIATPQVAKHRVFQWLDSSVLPDDKLIAIASDDALHLGVVSSQIHVQWAVASGGRLGVGNDPVYSKSTCFDLFPFPSEDTCLTPERTTRIRTLAEQLDAHRKTQQAAHPALTLTGMYNVLEKLRSGEPLNTKDKLIHTQGLVSVLKSLHDELDAAVLAAYGWSDLQTALTEHMHAELRAAAVDTLLERLAALNAKRAAEEAAGTVRWLRPDFQQRAAARQAELDVSRDEEDDLATDASGVGAATAATAPVAKRPWPAGLPAQIKAVADVLSTTPRPLALADVEARFTARGRWRDRLPTILHTLEALGRARRPQPAQERWQGL